MGYNGCGPNSHTKGNSMKSKHILTSLAAAALILPMTAILTATPSGEANAAAQRPAYTAATQSGASAEIFRQVNAYRAQNGLPALRRDPVLDQAAAVRAAEIAVKFSHTRPDGRHWSTVSDRASGENIARGHRTADKAMAAWMTSSGHRANILRARFGSIGIASVNINGVMYWVQLFGK